MNEKLARQSERALDVVGQLEQRLAEAKTPRESAQVARDAKSLAEVARGALGDRQTAAGYDVVFWRAARLTGELLLDLGREPGARTDTSYDRHTRFQIAIDDAQLQRDTAQRWQRLYKFDPSGELFEAFCESYLAGEVDSTAFALLGTARMRVPPANQRMPPPVGTYRCVVIDPPWPIEKVVKEVRPYQGVALDYATLSTEQLADEEWLPARGAMAPDGCHVYLWVTHRFLPTGLDLFDAWGVHYQCLMTWNKPVGPSPFSWMYDTEHVLFGIKGSLPLEQMGLRLSFSAPVQGHSVKPDVFYERVAAASPGPRIDMFARQRREGFELWGDEAPDELV